MQQSLLCYSLIYLLHSDLVCSYVFPRMLLVDISLYCFYSDVMPLGARDAFIISYAEPDQQGLFCYLQINFDYLVSSSFLSVLFFGVPLFLWVGCAS